MRMDLDKTKSNKNYSQRVQKMWILWQRINTNRTWLFICKYFSRCNCKEAQEYWNNVDKQGYEIEKRKHYKNIINKIYKKNYVEGKFQEQNLENFNINSGNEMAVKVAKDYTNKSIEKMQNGGLIITGESGVGKTHLAASIANKLIENDKIVLMGRLTMLLDMIKETFGDNTKSENELIELYSNVDMIIIDDLGTEKNKSVGIRKIVYNNSK